MAEWIFDYNDYEEKDYSLIPEGDHRVRIAEVAERTFKSGNEGFEITLEVSGHNSKIWHYIVLNPQNVKQTNQSLGAFFDSFGIGSSKLGNGQQWVGKVGAARVKHEEYNGKQSAKVRYFIPRSKQDKLPQWQGVSSAAAPQSGYVEVSVDDLPFA